MREGISERRERVGENVAARYTCVVRIQVWVPNQREITTRDDKLSDSLRSSQKGLGWGTIMIALVTEEAHRV